MAHNNEYRDVFDDDYREDISEYGYGHDGNEIPAHILDGPPSEEEKEPLNESHIGELSKEFNNKAHDLESKEQEMKNRRDNDKKEEESEIKGEAPSSKTGGEASKAQKEADRPQKEATENTEKASHDGQEREKENVNDSKKANSNKKRGPDKDSGPGNGRQEEKVELNHDPEGDERRSQRMALEREAQELRRRLNELNQGGLNSGRRAVSGAPSGGTGRSLLSGGRLGAPAKSLKTHLANVSGEKLQDAVDRVERDTKQYNSLVDAYNEWGERLGVGNIMNNSRLDDEQKKLLLDDIYRRNPDYREEGKRMLNATNDLTSSHENFEERMKTAKKRGLDTLDAEEKYERLTRKGAVHEPDTTPHTDKLREAFRKLMRRISEILRSINNVFVKKEARIPAPGVG